MWTRATTAIPIVFVNGPTRRKRHTSQRATGREMAATEPNWRRPDTFRLPNGQLIGPGCVRSPGTDVSPKQSGEVRVTSLASGHLTASCVGRTRFSRSWRVTHPLRVPRLKVSRIFFLRGAQASAVRTRWSTKSSVCLSGSNISLRAPFECQEEVGGWESFLHGINKAIGILGFFEFFFKN
jgi:hypothetical protein